MMIRDNENIYYNNSYININNNNNNKLNIYKFFLFVNKKDIFVYCYLTAMCLLFSTIVYHTSLHLQFSSKW